MNTIDITKLVKKKISREQEKKILSGKLLLMDSVGLMVNAEVDDVKYKFKLTNNKEFMKKWIDRKLNLELNKHIRDTDLAFIVKFTPYIDKYNTINFDKFKSDYEYDKFKMSKSRKPLLDLGIIKELDNVWYASPLLGTQQKNVPQELIEMFSEDMKKFNVDIIYN